MDAPATATALWRAGGALTSERPGGDGWRPITPAAAGTGVGARTGTRTGASRSAHRVPSRARSAAAPRRGSRTNPALRRGASLGGAEFSERFGGRGGPRTVLEAAATARGHGRVSVPAPAPAAWAIAGSRLAASSLIEPWQRTRPPVRRWAGRPSRGPRRASPAEVHRGRVEAMPVPSRSEEQARRREARRGPRRPEGARDGAVRA